jgi:hypothetical protein
MKAYVEVVLQGHTFLTSAIDGGECSASPPEPFIPGIRALGTHRMGDRVGPRAGLNDLKQRESSCPYLKSRNHF